MTSEHQAPYWDSVADTKTFTHPLDLALMSRYLHPGSEIVDYGCGYGRLVNALHKLDFPHVRGYDTSRNLIRRGQASGVTGLAFFEDLDTFPVAPASVDGFLLFAVLTCVPANAAQQRIMRTLHSCLKPGGIVYISDYYLQPDLTEVGRYGCWQDDPANYGTFTLPEGAAFRHHTREWIAELMQDFEIREETALEVRTMNGHSAQAFQMVVQKQG